MMNRTSVRNLAGVLCASVALVTAGLVFAPTAGARGADAPTTTMDMGGGGGGDGLLPPGNWTPSQRAYLLNLIHETEVDLPAFADPDYLVSIGFHNFGADAPGGYVHYINNAWIDDGRILDPTHPESILFQRVYDQNTGTSKLVLKAAMYFLPTGTTMANIPADVAWIPGWHVHTDLCVTDGGTFAGLVNSNGTCSSGHVMNGPPMTHVWIVDNGCGNRFSMVDVGGLMCNLDMPGEQMPTDSMDMPTASMPTGNPAMPMGTGSAAPVATAVAAQPTFTG